MRLCHNPFVLYGADYWTMRKRDEKKILTGEMCWSRKIV